MYDLALIVSAHPSRVKLMARSLKTWALAADAVPLNVAIRVYSDGWDATELVNNKLRGFDYKVKDTVEPSGSHIEGWNYWVEHEEANVYLFTHPEILFPSTTLNVAVREACPDIFVAFKVFWMTQQLTNTLEDYPWRTPEQLEVAEALYYPIDPSDKGSFYYNSDVRRNTQWESTTTWAVDREAAHKLFPFPDLHHQGYDDPLMAGLRKQLGIRTRVVMEPILFHQYHDPLWDGNAALAVQEATEELEKRFGKPNGC
jgi:hypothetical protein